MSNQDRIKRPNGAEWDTVKFACPTCGSTKFEFHMVDDEQHFVMVCEPVGSVSVGPFEIGQTRESFGNQNATLTCLPMWKHRSGLLSLS